MKQCTLKNAFTVKGKGLHTGLEIEATFKPAPENHGRKFLRTDIEGSAPIDAVAENVVETCRGTVLAVGDVKVSTAEHALAALYQVLLNFYRKIINPNDQVKIPLNCSELFTLSSSYWDSVEFHYVYIIGIDSSGYLNITNQFDSVK